MKSPKIAPSKTDYQSITTDQQTNLQQTYLQDNSPEQHQMLQLQQSVASSPEVQQQQQWQNDLSSTKTDTPQTDLERLDEILNYFDVPEKEVLEILGRLSAGDKKKVITGNFKSRLNACLNFEEMKKSCSVA